MKVDILILAAGCSERMGTPKQLLKIGKTTLLGATIKNAQISNANNIICVLGANASLIEPLISNLGIEIIINPNFFKGLGTSIAAGITNLKDRNIDGVIILLGDQPFVSSNYINSLITSFSEEPEYIIASRYNRKNGVPAIFPKKHFNQLLLLNQDKGAQDILNNSVNKVKTLSATPNLKDINTPADYIQLFKASHNI
tara:strand:+ start:1398 stop:1991 length:594 start_codon:yes stop_codon:yes gene_type:complete